MFGIKKLKRRITELEAALEERDGALRKAAHFSLTYTLTESDLIKHKQQTARKKDATERMACSLGYKILKRFPPHEIINDGVVVGYHVEIDARRPYNGTGM